MRFLPLPCARFLCKQDLRRFHVTCLYCRWRRRWLGKFTWGKMVTWVLPWSESDAPEAIQIDQRGHGLMLRCCFIIVLIRLAHAAFRLSRDVPDVRKWFMAPWVNVAECVADVPFP